MKKIVMCISAIAAGSLCASSLYADTTSHDLSANIVFKIGSKTYNGATSGVLNITPEPSPSPTPTPISYTSVTYKTPTGTDAVTVASSFVPHFNVESVVGAGGLNGTLTFNCESGYRIMDKGLNLPEHTSTDSLGTGASHLYYSSKDGWQYPTANSILYSNNKLRTASNDDYLTVVTCVPIS